SFLDGVVAPIGTRWIAVTEGVAGDNVGARVAGSHSAQALVEPQSLPVHHGVRAVDQATGLRRLVFIIQGYPFALNVFAGRVLSDLVAGTWALQVFAVAVRVIMKRLSR